MKYCLALAALVVSVIIGCSYSTHSRLPEHIKSISVGMFGNPTQYLHIEGKLTNALIKEIGVSPRYKVVNSNADAELSGEITQIRNVVLEYDANRQPKEMQVSVSVKFSLYDKVADEFLITNMEVQNTQSSTLVGRFSVDTGDGWNAAANAAMEEAAKLIVRRIMMLK